MRTTSSRAVIMPLCIDRTQSCRVQGHSVPAAPRARSGSSGRRGGVCVQDLAGGAGPGGAQVAIRPCCGDGNRPGLCWQRGRAQDHGSQEGLGLLPDTGLRPLPLGPEQQHWGGHWSPGVWLDPDSCTKPSTLGSRTRAQRPLPALPWLLGSLLILQPSLSRASQQNYGHKSFLRASGSLAWQPASPSRSWHPNIALSRPKEPLGTGWPRPAAHQPSHGDIPSLAGTVWWHMEAQAVLSTLPSVGCLCQRLLPEGSLQESAASPVPGWFYTPRGRDNVRKSPERGMRPEAPGQRGLRPEISYSRSDSSDNSEGPGCL